MANLQLSFAPHSYQKRSSSAKTSAWVALVPDNLALGKAAKQWDQQSKGALSRALKTARFKGRKGQFLSILAPAGLDCERIVLAGTGKEQEASDLALQALGGGLFAYLNQSGVKAAIVSVEGGKHASAGAAHIAYGAELRSYRFDKYFTKQTEDDKPTLTALTLEVDEAKSASRAFAPLQKIADGIFLTRDLVSEPANIIYPESLAARCKELSKLGVTVEILGEGEMRRLGMGSLLGVGQGSERESRLVVLRWNGGAKAKAPVAFVGKGVTFDTGGISIKPASGMEEMKWDMGGAGTVIGLMAALSGRKAKVNAVGVVGLVENMPDGNAQRPGDVVKSMSGQTIEVINTDAEGRLVLADALWYTKERFKPKLIVDLATLTGAIIIALGSSRAGLFANDDELAQQLFDAGKATGEDIWRLPLGDVYDKQINSDIADMKNVGEGREAGSITAAQFLQRFVGDTPWAHLDIAGVAWTKKPLDTCPKGATAFGIRLLNQFVAENYE